MKYYRVGLSTSHLQVAEDSVCWSPEHSLNVAILLAQVAVYRAVLAVGAFGGLLVTAANMAGRDLFWSFASLVGTGGFLVVGLLYLAAMLQQVAVDGRLPLEQVRVRE